jgi:hypothetical protein
MSACRALNGPTRVYRVAGFYPCPDRAKPGWPDGRAGGPGGHSDLRSGAGVQRQEVAPRWRNPSIMAAPATHVEQLERVLLRRGLGALEADRTACADCGRTPLTGEHVHLYAERGDGIVCELCRGRRREAPVASELVRHCEHGHTVRLTARAA